MATQISAKALHLGDCLEVLRTLPDCSVHAVVTDPPYGLSEHKPAEVVELADDQLELELDAA